MPAELAINSGTKTVSIEDPEQWERPIEAQKEAVEELVEAGYLSGAGSGLPREFEEKFREYVGADYCLTVDHGSTALASAYYAVGVGPGDEVITPTVGYLGAYAGALHIGARPVFCEVDPDTLLADPADIENRITEHTAAINVTHWNGRVCDMSTLLEIGDQYGLPIVEDAAHAHGSKWDGEHIGNIGDITCFSLQGVSPGGKPIAAGEGGIVTTNDRKYYERQLAFCHLHRASVEEELTLSKYEDLEKQVLGNKWRAHPLALAIAQVELDSLEYRCQQRIQNRERLFDHLEDLPGIRPVETYEKSDSAGFYGGLKVVYNSDELDGLPIESFVEAVSAEGVPISGPGFAYVEHLRSINRQGFDLWGDDRGPLGGEFCGLPPFEPYEEGDFPIAEDLDDRVLTLSSYIEPVEGFIDQYARVFEKVVDNYDQLL